MPEREDIAESEYVEQQRGAYWTKRCAELRKTHAENERLYTNQYDIVEKTGEQLDIAKEILKIKIELNFAKKVPDSEVGEAVDLFFNTLQMLADDKQKLADLAMKVRLSASAVTDCHAGRLICI